MGYINKFNEWIKHKMQRIKIGFYDFINRCDCPYDPDDNPFPQSCDKRIINTDYCKDECPWRDLERLSHDYGVHDANYIDREVRLTYKHRVEKPNDLNMYQYSILDSVGLDPRIFEFVNYIEIWDGIRTNNGNPVLEVVGVEYRNIMTGNTLVVKVNKGGPNKVED